MAAPRSSRMMFSVGECGIGCCRSAHRPGGRADRTAAADDHRHGLAVPRVEIWLAPDFRAVRYAAVA